MRGEGFGVVEMHERKVLRLFALLMPFMSLELFTSHFSHHFTHDSHRSHIGKITPITIPYLSGKSKKKTTIRI